MTRVRRLSEIGLQAGARLMLVFAHPDDESVFSGGFIQKARREGLQVRLLALTSGGRSSRRLGLSPADDLEQARARELAIACRILCCSDFKLCGLPDAALADHRAEMEAALREEMRSYRPEAIVTFEPGGGFAHPDHIATSAAVTRARAIVAPAARLLFAMAPTLRPGETRRAFARQKPDFALVLSFAESLRKFRAISCHRSQFSPRMLGRWGLSRMMRLECYRRASGLEVAGEA
jgi:LmbE family N-acetylglucosaminyl deacetylase